MSTSTPTPHPPPRLQLNPLLSTNLFYPFHLPLSSILVLDPPSPTPSSTPSFTPLFDASNTCTHPVGLLPATSPPVTSLRAVFGLIHHYEDLGPVDAPEPCFIEARAGDEFVTVSQFIREFDAYLRSPEVEDAAEMCGGEEMVLVFGGGEEEEVYYPETDEEGDEDERERGERRRRVEEEKRRFEGVKMVVVEYEPEAVLEGCALDGERGRMFSREEVLERFKERMVERWRVLGGNERDAIEEGQSGAGVENVAGALGAASGE